MTLSKKEQTIQVIDAAFESALKDQSSGFAWELFWQFGIVSKLQDFNFKLMSDAISSGNLKDFDKLQTIDVNGAETLEIIKERKKALNKEHNIKRVKFDFYRERIVTFFKDKRNVDFNSLDDVAAKSLLQREDIMSSTDNIYDALGMTHMQYKYLYQRDGVQLQH
jgi:hypothetical protein